MKRKIIRYFNQSAHTYNAAAAVQEYIAERLALRVKKFSAKKILEIGCGTGLFSQHLCELFPKASLLLTDVAPNMIQVCRERYTHHKQVETLCLDGELLATASSFDLITSSMTLHWFENFNQAFKNILEQLSPGGSVVFAMLGENSLHEWREMCAQFQISAATQLFPKQNELKINFPDLQINLETFTHVYENAYAFLNSIKSLGARASHASYIPTTSGKLRKLLRSYTKEINMTYEVIYGAYTKV